MNPQVYQVLHVGSVLLLFALTFSAFADPRPSRKRALSIGTGVTALIALVAAFGLIAKLGYSYTAPWIWMKLAIWLGIAAMAGMVFRRPAKAGLFAWIAALLGILAVWVMYHGRFLSWMN